MAKIIGIGIFIAVFLLIAGVYLMFRNRSDSEARLIKKRLRTLSAGALDFRELDIIRKRMLSEVPWLNRILLSITRIHELDRLVEQANTRLPLGFFILLSLLLVGFGFTGGIMMRMNHFINIIMAGLLGTLPFLYLVSLKQRRMLKFQEQLPDALDLIARSLKAGHAFQGGLSMVAEEFGDPTGTEFRNTLDEINFGVGVDQAMKNLAQRVGCPDLQFFVVSVIIQRETGGNLAEILEKIASLIRERFKFYGKVRSLAAEGKLSAAVLLSLPVLLAAYFSTTRPEYIGMLLQDPVGIIMAVSAIVMMTAGFFVMKRMVNIKV